MACNILNTSHQFTATNSTRLFSFYFTHKLYILSLTLTIALNITFSQYCQINSILHVHDT